MHESVPIPPAPVENTLVPGSVVSGYRLVRRVTDAPGTVVWLASAPGSGQAVCVSVVQTTDAVERRIAAHGRVSSPHVLALVDLATDSYGRIVLVTERTDWTLATLLTSRARLAPGEAVTVLAPLVAGLASIHGENLTHGNLTPSTVLFCPDGRPVLGGLETVRKQDATSVERDPGVSADYVSLANLISVVGGMVDEPARTSLLDLSRWIPEQLSNTQTVGSLLGQVECRLFTLAPALPVVLVADRRPPAEPTRSGGTRGSAGFSLSAHRATETLPVLGRAASALASTGVGGFLSRVLRGRALALCLGTVMLVATLIAGLTLLPERSAPETHTTIAPTGSQAPPRLAAANAPEDAGRDAAVTGDDPEAATAVLLERRARCATEESTTCVSRYAEAGSALADADTHAFGESTPGSLLLGSDGAASAVQHVQSYGDAALLNVVQANDKRQPVLILAVRTDTGWRLRDLFEPD